MAVHSLRDLIWQPYLLRVEQKRLYFPRMANSECTSKGWTRKKYTSGLLADGKLGLCLLRQSTPSRIFLFSLLKFGESFGDISREFINSNFMSRLFVVISEDALLTTHSWTRPLAPHKNLKNFKADPMIVQTGTHMRSFPLRTQRQIATFEVCGWVPLDCVITLGIAFAPSAFARRCVVEGIDPDVHVASSVEQILAFYNFNE